MALAMVETENTMARAAVLTPTSSTWISFSKKVRSNSFLNPTSTGFGCRSEAWKYTSISMASPTPFPSSSRERITK